MTNQLWKPDPELLENAQVTLFIAEVESRFQQSFNNNFHQFRNWSAAHPEEFWGTVWDFCKIKASKSYDTVVKDFDRMPGAKWFPGARLNFAENLLRFQDDHPAIISWNERGPSSRLTYQELYNAVAGFASLLQSLEIKKGDRVAAVLPNIPEAMIAMLGTTACGAIWSSCSPDFETTGILNRFSQIEPRVLVVADGYHYRGKEIHLEDRIQKVLQGLPSVEIVIVVPYIAKPLNLSCSTCPFPDPLKNTGIIFEQTEPDHPVYILYSSGTTGAPKCIVHGAVNMLVGQIKELMLGVDLKRSDKFFYGTTCGWMMWNWLVAGLSTGSTLLLYEGFPLAREGNILFDLAEKEGMTVFGTSAGFLQKIEQIGLKPAETHDLSSLRAIYSTGSRLKPESFDYVYRDFANVLLCPIWGGTDLCGLLGGSSPLLPVYKDQIQTRALGIDVDVVDLNGISVRGEPGEVVVRKPFPQMPVQFWNDPDGEKYQKAYFSWIPGIWKHGDLAVLSEEEGLIVLGRSDDTLNPGGVRIGSAEVTGPAEEQPEVVEAAAVIRETEEGDRVVLFVILEEGKELTEDLKNRIRSAMPSPRHRPKEIYSVPDFPTTRSGKRSIRAIRDIINGREVPNTEALQNPEALKLFGQFS